MKIKSLIYVLIASFVWASIGAVLRTINIGPLGFFFISSFFSLCTALLYLGGIKKLGELKETEFTMDMFIFAVLQTILVSASFYAFSDPEISTSAVILITNATPLLIALIAPILIKEKSTKAEVIFAIIGFFGLIIFVYGQSTQGLEFNFSYGLILAFLAFVLNAFVSIMNRQVSQKNPDILIPVILSTGNFIITLPLVLFLRIDIFSISLNDFLVTAVMGVFGGMLCFLFMAKAYKVLKVQLVSIILLSQVIFAGILGFFFLGEIFNFLMILGTIIVLGANIGVVLSQKNRVRE
ncbi:EamA family transporter [Candidatus Dojkabacteria bacterium]|nr:EamA family transporter [Candidatus Dojkabacteria bacterium]